VRIVQIVAPLALLSLMGCAHHAPKPDVPVDPLVWVQRGLTVLDVVIGQIPDDTPESCVALRGLSTAIDTSKAAIKDAVAGVKAIPAWSNDVSDCGLVTPDNDTAAKVLTSVAELTATAREFVGALDDPCAAGWLDASLGALSATAASIASEIGGDGDGVISQDEFLVAGCP